ncbi:MAG: 2-dehydropantoate 2-reductase [Pedobacter sp.]|nr:2-dehydropantoate 2-reductase [Pedobacter sp.]
MTSIAVFGAGSIGCYVGGRLQAAGAAVTLIGRPRLGEVLQSHGLTLSDYHGWEAHIPAAALNFHQDAAALAAADLVLVTVKSADSATAAQTLAGALKPDALVISLQNGLHNAEALAAHLPQHTVLAGMVPFNVAQTTPGHFHQGSEGFLAVQADARLAAFRQAFAQAGLALEEHADMKAVQWAKLLLNLNNAVNALSGLPLKTELEQRDYRQVLAAAQKEAIALLQEKNQPLAKLTPLPAHWIPKLLRVPDAVFRIAAKKMLAIDPLARSSMQDDLNAGRKTEIDVLQGEIMALAAAAGKSAPVNAKLLQLVHEAESGGRRNWSGAELRRAVLNTQ